MRRLNQTEMLYWNRSVNISGIELWNDLTSEKFVIEDGHIVACGKEENDDQVSIRYMHN